jgi:hypothetical protein
MANDSVFMDKLNVPLEQELAEKLGSTYTIWLKVHDFVMQQYPAGVGGWNFPGKKYGWSYRIKDKKRAIIYLIPKENYFMVVFVFGEKATKRVMDSKVSQTIKSTLQQATPYTEGRGIGIEVKDESVLKDIEILTEIKITT